MNSKNTQQDSSQQHPDEPFYRRVMVLMMVSAVALAGVAVFRR